MKYINTQASKSSLTREQRKLVKAARKNRRYNRDIKRAQLVEVV
jgi:hypothetical protein